MSRSVKGRGLFIKSFALREWGKKCGGGRLAQRPLRSGPGTTET